MNKITLVTALYNINRETEGDGRTFDDYLKWFAETLKISSPMVIYVDKDLEQFVRLERGSRPTKIITQPLDEVPYYYLDQDIKNILNSTEYQNKIGAPARVECKLSLYNVIIYSKFKWMKLAVEDNYFDSEYFMWVDAGLSRFFNGISKTYPSSNAIESLLSNKDSVLIQTSMSYYPDLVNSDECTENYFWDARTWIMAGLWGGGSDIMLKFCNEMDNILVNKMLANNVINNEQNAMAYLYKNDTDMFITFENYAHIHNQYELIQELAK